MGTSNPPPSPPPPPPDVQHTSKSVKMSSQISPFIQKLQEAPEGYWFEPEIEPETIDTFDPPAGFYFFYGTLMDASLLSEILNLPEKPTLRPAKLVGYSLKLWGQYPALIDGPTGATVEGVVYEVESAKHAGRLAAYETEVYTHAPCTITFMDGKEPREVNRWTFMYDGNPVDINDGEFDLTVWLRRMGRARPEGT